MILLDKNFEIEKYGLNVRFVNENDSEYIIGLRTDPKLGKYLNPTHNDIENQKKWIREYKKREELGEDYYFIYSHNGENVGVNRIYKIKDKTASSGSWICSPDLPFELPFLTLVILREIFFELLKLEVDFMDTRKENKKVIRMHLMLGSHITDESEVDVFHCLTNEDFKKNKLKFLDYIGIKF
jgi:hypothetical protein